VVDDRRRIVRFAPVDAGRVPAGTTLLEATMRGITAAALSAVLLVTCALAGCGGGEKPTGGARAKAATGTIAILETTAQSETIARWAKTAQQAITAAGWKAVVADGKGDPSVWSASLTNFINQKVDGIITMGVDGAPVASQLKAAKDAGIPVIAAGVSVSGKELFAAKYAPEDSEFGRVLADYLKATLPAGADYVSLDISAIYAAHALVTSAKPLLESAGFKHVGGYDINVSDLVNDTGKGTANLVQGHPDAKFILSCCDAPAINVAALQQARRPNVLTAARNDNPSTLKLIRAGAPLVVAVSNSDIGVLTAIDQIVAAKAGRPIDPAADRGKYEYTAVDKSDVPADGEFVYDTKPIIEQYVKKWRSGTA
jgi:ABC-type sugar transport system substrate-binding protein